MKGRKLFFQSLMRVVEESCDYCLLATSKYKLRVCVKTRENLANFKQKMKSATTTLVLFGLGVILTLSVVLPIVLILPDQQRNSDILVTGK